MAMVFIYDGSYEGLLSCIFTIFKDRRAPVAINTEENHQFTLLDAVTRVVTNDDWAARVLKGIDERTESQASVLLYKIFLSGLPSCEMLVYQVVQAIIHKGDVSVLENFANPYILKAMQIEKMIHREVHRMHAFVRFQKRRDGLFYAAIDPDFNVLPLIGEHFEKRYADQRWLIFDTHRHYGLYYDLEKMEFVNEDNPVFGPSENVQQDDLSLNDLPRHDLVRDGLVRDNLVRDDSIRNSSAQDSLLQKNGLLQENTLLDEKEKQYQALWENYFHAVNIRERNNAKLHLRHMPRRYWKYLTEKSGFYKRSP